jgi:hypothetical protein
VIIQGVLLGIEPDTEAMVDASEYFSKYATSPSLTVHNYPLEELEPEWYELDIESMTGYQAPDF